MSDQTFNRPFIGYDGSKNCHDLITVFQRMHNKFQHSTFVFVWDPVKNFIPTQAKGPYIDKQIKQKTQGLSNVEIKLAQKQHSEPKTTNQYILEQFLKTKSTFLMLGFYGSKGEKVRSIDLSSRVRQFVYDSKNTVAIIKNKDRGTNTAIFCSDGSQVSYEGLKKAIAFCKKFGYILTIIHAYNNETKAYGKQVKIQLKAIQDSTKDVKIDLIVQKADLLEQLSNKAQNYDWIIVTKNGYRGQISKKVFIGSHTTEILTKVNCNILIL